MAGIDRERNRLTTDLSAKLKLAFENHKHRVCRTPLTHVGIARLKGHLLSLA